MSIPTPTPSVTFRLATPADALPLTHLINTAFRNDPTTQVFLSLDLTGIDVTTTPSITSSITSPDYAILVATEPDNDEILLAHCSVRKLNNTGTGGVAWLGLLAVNVQHQNRGLGRQMLTYAEGYAQREWGVGRMEFDVVCTRAELIAWYGKQGYVATGETRPFPYEFHEGWEEVLRGDLEFVVMGRDLGVGAGSDGVREG
jgi:GNAT superfamily N-acetyltransferase